MIEWVGKIWYSDSISSNEMILNSFKYAEISNQLDGNQDHKFRGYEDLEKEKKIIKKWKSVLSGSWLCSK